MARGNSPRQPNARDGKPPAFQLYVADWLTSQTVRCMSHAERGAYMDLLCFSWQNGSIPSELDRIARLVGVDPITLAEWWVAIGPCWIPKNSVSGRLVNERQEFERKKVAEYREAKSRAGKLGAEARYRPDTQPSDSGAKTLPLAKDSLTFTTTSSITKRERRSLAKTMLEKMNDRREELGLRRLSPTDGNLKPIVARLGDYDEKAILRAWNGASRDEWVLENNKLLPGHVLRPSAIDGYLDAGTPRTATTVRDQHSGGSMIQNEWECGECRRITMVATPKNARDKPAGYKCGGCKDRAAHAQEIAARGESGVQEVAEILAGIRPDRLAGSS